jgi:hypothetical protein
MKALKSDLAKKMLSTPEGRQQLRAFASGKTKQIRFEGKLYEIYIVNRDAQRIS